MNNNSTNPKLRIGLAPFALAFAAFALTAYGVAEPFRPETQTSPTQGTSQTATVTKEEQELLTLSKDKWGWMADRKVDSLDALFREKAVFVHMGATMTKKQELDTIRSGGIQYKKAEIQEASVRFIGDTAIVLNRIRLPAIVGGNEVVNPFVVTEVYVKERGTWKLGSLSFTRTLGQ